MTGCESLSLSFSGVSFRMMLSQLLKNRDVLTRAVIKRQISTNPFCVSIGTGQEVDGYFSTLAVECAVVILGEHRGDRLV